MLKSTGKVTEVCNFSLLEDQITIEVEIPSNQGDSLPRGGCAAVTRVTIGSVLGFD
jgi:hypothetical protein